MRLSLIATFAAGLALAGCASKPAPLVLVSEPAPPVVASLPPPIEISPINRGLSPAATVWHFRAALNVAALACRGANETTIVAGYNTLLAAHRSTLASAETTLAGEFRAAGDTAWRDRYDDSMTRLYNFFSQAQARDGFCAAAGRVLAESAALAPDALQPFAERWLPILDAPFAEAFRPRTVIAFNTTTPPIAPSSQPRLSLDMTAIDR